MNGHISRPALNHIEPEIKFLTDLDTTHTHHQKNELD